MLATAVLAAFATPLPAATRYDGDGDVPSRLEVLRWLINRARYAPEMEADRLSLTNTYAGGHPDYDCCEDTDLPNDFGTNAAQWALWKASKPPLALNARLCNAASNHSSDMAQTDTLSHLSPSSNYYPLNSTPWVRMTNENYFYASAGENVARGTKVWFTPERAHQTFFVDNGVANRGHRQGILNYTHDFREIGLGADSNGVREYYTEDFGGSGTVFGVHFVTDTIFFDANADKAYSEGEGIANIEVRLYRGAVEASFYDVSGSSGGFAVPIADLADGATIGVWLVNKSGTTREITIPVGFANMGNLQLTNNEARLLGTYMQPVAITNIGFRNVDPVFSNTAAFLASTNTFGISFSAFKGASYTVQWSSNLLTNAWSTIATVTATGFVHTVTDPNATNAAVRFYRTLLVRD